MKIKLLIGLPIVTLIGILTSANVIEIEKPSYKNIQKLIHQNPECTVLKDATCLALRDEKINLMEMFNIRSIANKCHKV